VSVESEVVVMLAATQKAFGKVDILVNNAGAYAFSAIEAVTLEDFNRQFTTNVFELLLVTKTGLLFSPRRAAASSTSAQWSAPWPRQREVFTPAPKPPLIRSRKRSRRNSDPKISV
jgi:NAD(P)-dependent dehydrogenase (short-subunit alcohol dehydrogenase family)